MTESDHLLRGGSLPLTAVQATADEADLQTAITELASLVSGSLGLAVLLERVAAAAEEAFTSLRWMSQSSNTKVNVVAQRIVDEAG